MLKDKRFIAVLGVLLLVVAVLDIRYFMNRADRQKRPAPATVHAVAPATPVTTTDRAPRASGAPSATALDHNHPLTEHSRNPFLASATKNQGKFRSSSTEKNEAALPFRFGGIAWVAGRWTALIDGEPVTEGTRLGDYRIMTIEQDHLVVRREGRRWTISLPDLEHGDHTIGKQS